MENGWLVCSSISRRDHSLFDIFDERGRYIGQFKAGIFPDYAAFSSSRTARPTPWKRTKRASNPPSASATRSKTTRKGVASAA